MKSISARILYGRLILLVMVTAVYAETPGPLAVKVFDQSVDGKRKPLPNVRVHIGMRYAATDTTGMAIFEGIPSGQYKLAIQQPDYQILEQQITLAKGARDAIDITLVKAAIAQWGGTISSAVDSLPLAGVMVDLKPMQVKAALSGAAHSITTWDGHFEFIDIPVGRYQMRVAAPGFSTITREVEVAGVDMSKQAQFDSPLIDGVALDICREWGAHCKKPAADLFCQTQGFFEAIEHRVEYDKPPTRIITSKKLCKDNGCDRIVWIRCAGELPDPFTLQLQPESKTNNQTISVSDNVTGKPVPNAKITLAETWPIGHIAEAQTDASGKVIFNALKTGTANHQNTDGKVAISRPRITAHIEAVGYESSVVPFSLNEQAPILQVQLNPETQQTEAEPNNDLEQAQEIRTGAPITFKIAERGDRDFFKFRLVESAKIKLAIDKNTPLSTLMTLRDATGKQLKRQGGYAGKGNAFEQRLEGGSYSVEITEWGDDASDPENDLTLLISTEPAVDPNEPNQQEESATPIYLNHQASGIIWPLGDVDYYRLEITQAGILRLNDLHKTMQRHVRILSRYGKLLTEQGAYENRPLSLEYAVTPGVYLIEMREWGDNNASLEPYRINIEMLPDDGVVDPVVKPGAMEAVRSLPSHIWFASTLLPSSDEDLFSVSIPGAGVLRIQSKGPMQRHLKVYDAKGNLLQEKGGYERNPVDLDWHASGPGTIYVAITEWGKNSYSALPYSMRVWFERADEIDYQQRNEDFIHSTPILSGDTLYGSYLPIKDQDFYAVDIDFPGVLEVTARSARQTHLRIFDSEQKLIAEQGVYENNTAKLSPEVNTGLYYIALNEWGDNSASTEPYELKVVLNRAEPTESIPLDQDAMRILKDGEAQSFLFDQRSDRDRFLFELPKDGKTNLSIASQSQVLVKIFNDQTGEKIHESGHYDPVKWTLPLKFKEATRLRIELSEWGNNSTSKRPGFIMLDNRGRALHADAIEATTEGAEPELVSFRKMQLDYAQPTDRCEIDLNGDGRPELTLNDEKSKQGRFPREGRYVVGARCFGPAGQTSQQKLWVQASGNRAREGIALFLNVPVEGQTIDRPTKLAAQAMSYSGRPIAGVRYMLDGEHLATDYSPPFDTEVNWQNLVAGQHKLEVAAFDASGVETKLNRQFKLAEYFDISPPNGAVLSGEVIRVSWLAPKYGESLLRFRKRGADDWKTVKGQSGRLRVIELADLEPSVPYEIQPMGGSEPGPIYTLTRVKGLAFGRSHYGANIKRDYNQRVGISVRNNGDAPLSVRLECGKPKDPLLLVGFVGEGSEDKPINLAPGEVRQFMLGISAQDVNTADHSIPVRIVSDNGLSDEAEVAVHVRLPHVELQWEDLGPLPLGHGRKLRLHNKGDTITDLQVVSEQSQAVKISPTVQHGLLSHNRSIDFTVTPRFYDGFKGVQSRILARGLNKSFNYDYEMKLANGERVRQIWLFPGMNPSDKNVQEKEPELIRNARQAEKFDPLKVDWNRRDNPEDLDGDGRSDRWSMTIDNIRWVGDDTDADSVIDFVHADVGDDGIFEYSALLDGDKWHKTNLVEAWLEMGFSLPWSRNSYHPHNTDIVLNGRVIGGLHDTIPEGNYTFRIPPAALRFDKDGLPGDNRIGINSKHLRGGHYVVNSDFRFKFRLTATPVWTVAKSEDDARQMAANIGGLAIDAPDLSLSSSEVWLDAPALTKAGDEIVVEIPVNNLGSMAVPDVDVALLRKTSGRKREEITRINVKDIALHGGSVARFNWKATAGSSSFFLVVDPDKQTNDLDRANNEANFFLPIKGEEKPVRITFQKPKPGTTVSGAHLILQATINQEAGTVEPALSIDGGLWTELSPVKEKVFADLLLQPGDHRLELRVVDSSGNSTTEVISVKVNAGQPQAHILAPKMGELIAERHAHVTIAIPEKTALVGVRAAGGPWHKAVLTGTEADVDLPLRFGKQTIEAIVVNQQGVVKPLSVDVTCSAQPIEGEERVVAGAEQQGLLWPNPDSELALDLFQTTNGLMQQVKREERLTAQRVESAAPANTAAMDPKMRERYEQAKRLRIEGGKLQAKGRLQEAINKYRQSLRLYPDYRLEGHIQLIEGVLNGKASTR